MKENIDLKSKMVNDSELVNFTARSKGVNWVVVEITNTVKNSVQKMLHFYRHLGGPLM
jgi:hypothetical protein